MAPRRDVPTIASQYDFYWGFDPKKEKYGWISVPIASQPSQASAQDSSTPK